MASKCPPPSSPSPIFPRSWCPMEKASGAIHPAGSLPQGRGWAGRRKQGRRGSPTPACKSEWPGSTEGMVGVPSSPVTGHGDFPPPSCPLPRQPQPLLQGCPTPPIPACWSLEEAQKLVADTFPHGAAMGTHGDNPVLTQLQCSHWPCVRLKMGPETLTVPATAQSLSTRHWPRRHVSFST